MGEIETRTAVVYMMAPQFMAPGSGPILTTLTPSPPR